jgi:lysophospholipase L1-like esterase
MPQNTEPTLILPFWKKLLFSSVLLVILFTILETGACVYLKATQGYDGEHQTQYEFDSYKNMLPARNYVDTRGIRHNAQGFRHDGDVTREKPDGTLRVFFMGASTAYGLGGLWKHIQTDYAVIDNDDLISAYLERELAAAFPDKKVEVINAAITSVWTHHHLIYLNQTILSYDPDMIVLMDGFNDFFRTDPNHDQFASYSYGEKAHVIMGEPTLRSLATANGWWFFRKSSFINVTGRSLRAVKYLLTPEPEQPALDVDGTYNDFVQIFERSALTMNRRIASLLQLEEIPALFVMQPMLILERDRLASMPEVEQRLFAYNVESYRPNYEEFMTRAAPHAANRMNQTVRGFDAGFFDATGIFRPDESEQIYTDYCHLTPYANELLAKKIAARVIPMLGVEATPADNTPASDASGD